MNEFSWLQRHERLILGTLLLLVALFLFNKFLDDSAKRDSINAALADKALQDQKDTNTQMRADYLRELSTLTEQNVKLAQQIQVRNQQVKKQQQTDQALPLPDLGKRWVGLIGAKPEDIQAAPTGLLVSEAASHSTVDQLELVPALQANLQDQEKTVSNKDTQIASLNQQIGGLNEQIKKADAACKAEIGSVKADARKSKRNWFIRGAVSGAALVAWMLLR